MAGAIGFTGKRVPWKPPLSKLLKMSYPTFPGVAQRLHWSFPDPSRATGSDEEKMAQARAVRDQIRAQIEEWAASVGS